MARPVDHKKRLEIALGALEVLRERGLIGTSMSQIASALGMKRPTLYWYFPDLQSIFECALVHVRQEEAAFVAERIIGKAHPVDLLDSFVRAEFDFYRERGYTDLLVLMMQFYGRFGLAHNIAEATGLESGCRSFGISMHWVTHPQHR